MKKHILVVDWLLILVFVLMIGLKVAGSSLANIVQPIFLVLILIHIIQHWKVIAASLKRGG